MTNRERLKSRLAMEGRQKEDIQTGKLQISSALSILISRSSGQPVPRNDIRITKGGRVIKISGRPGFDISADLCAEEKREDIKRIIDILSSKYDTGFGEVRVPHSEKSRRIFGELGTEIARIREARSRAEGEDACSGIMIRSLTVEILACLSRKTEAEMMMLPACRGCTPDQAKTARAVCGYILSHLEEKICMASLGGIFGMSQTKIKESFRMYYGEPAAALIRKEKMDAAAVLLERTELKIADIAGRLGYQSAGKFTKAFREVIGINPGEFRRGEGRRTI